MRRVIVVHRDRKSQRTLSRVIASGVGPVTVVETPAAARALVDGATAAVVSAEAAAGPGFGELAAAVRTSGGHLLLCGEGGPTAVLTLVRDHELDHVVSSDPVDLADELPLTLRALAAPAGLCELGAARYLSHGARLEELVPTRTHERVALLGRLREGLAAMELSARQERQAALVADELLANAIYDAPCARDEARRESARAADREIIPAERPRLRWGSDGRHVAIEVTDPFGAVSPATIRAHVARLIDRSTSPRQGNGGAGLGLAMTFLATSQLVFHLAPGRATQAIGLIDLRARPDGGRALVPSLHLHTEPGAATSGRTHG